MKSQPVLGVVGPETEGDEVEFSALTGLLQVAVRATSSIAIKSRFLVPVPTCSERIDRLNSIDYFDSSDFTYNVEEHIGRVGTGRSRLHLELLPLGDRLDEVPQFDAFGQQL